MEKQKGHINNYSHSKYAGGDADIVKHALTASVCARIGAVIPEVRYVDTHAGAGLYELNSSMDSHWKEGYAKFSESGNTSGCLKPYLRVLSMVPASSETIYPGSPWIGKTFCRELFLFEYDREVAASLARAVPGAQVFNSNGFQEAGQYINSSTIFFMDPPYKEEQDYIRVLETASRAKEMQARAVIIWYPLIFSKLTGAMTQKLEELFPECVNILIQRKPHIEGEMTGYGMFCSHGDPAADWPGILGILKNALPIKSISINGQDR